MGKVGSRRYLEKGHAPPTGAWIERERAGGGLRGWARESEAESEASACAFAWSRRFVRVQLALAVELHVPGGA